MDFVISSFSELWLSANKANSPLPVKLKSFDVVCNKDKKYFRWSTLSEQNASHYIISESQDLINWKEIARHQAVLNSNELVHYEVLSTTLEDEGYYLLTLFHIDGTSEVLDIKKNDCDYSLFNIFPNPVSDVLYIEGVKNAGVLKVHTIDGKIVFNENVLSNLSIDIHNWAKGIYLVSFYELDSQKVFYEKNYSKLIYKKFTTDWSSQLFKSSALEIKNIGCTKSGAISTRGTSVKFRRCSRGCGISKSSDFVTLFS